jgi:hypothetical protein
VDLMDELGTARDLPPTLRVSDGRADTQIFPLTSRRSSRRALWLARRGARAVEL